MLRFRLVFAGSGVCVGFGEMRALSARALNLCSTPIQETEIMVLMLMHMDHVLANPSPSPYRIFNASACQEQA